LNSSAQSLEAEPGRCARTPRAALPASEFLRSQSLDEVASLGRSVYCLPFSTFFSWPAVSVCELHYKFQYCRSGDGVEVLSNSRLVWREVDKGVW